jgi:hypothetical protein
VAHEYTAMKIRLRERLRAKVEKAATAHDVSLNEEIVGRLEASFERDEKTNVEDALLALAMGDDRNGKILSMVAAVLYFADLTRADHGKDEADWLQCVESAITMILAVVNGNGLIEKPLEPSEVDDMPPARGNGIVIADVILQKRGYPALINRPVNDKRTPLQKLMGMPRENAE